ncbi:MAG: hypothetical protein JWM14_3131 [Chitinophagaceae bacterium]|nr:hypothetical protein [Chitinophagaceae bacterium]
MKISNILLSWLISILIAIFAEYPLCTMVQYTMHLFLILMFLTVTSQSIAYFIISFFDGRLIYMFSLSLLSHVLAFSALAYFIPERKNYALDDVVALTGIFAVSNFIFTALSILLTYKFIRDTPDK